MYYINKRQKSILRLIEKFGCISFQQIINIVKDRNNLERDINGLVRRNLIKSQGNIYMALAQQNIDNSMLKCIDVICYLEDKLLKCEKEQFPFCLWVYLKNGHNYDICYIPEGQEMLYTSSINRCCSISNIIIILDDMNQMNEINLQHENVRLCTLNPIKFYKL